jgi:sensor histidine kinase YesM
MAVMEERYETGFIYKYWSNFKNIIIDGLAVGVINTLIAVVLTVIGPIESFLIVFLMVHFVGAAISFIILLSLLLFKPRTWLLFFLITGIDIFCGVFVGMQMGIWVLHFFFNITLDWQKNNLNIQAMIAGVIIGSVMLYSVITKIRLKYRNAMIEMEKIKRLTVEKESLLANLRMLQAQIEPHFLFNTLSNILSLIDTKPDKGKSILLNLTKYLRTSLSRTLPEKNTLSQEISMIQAYLDIQKIRMDERLHYQIDVPDNLWQHAFPPMLMQPLVENAIKHGLEPNVEGGSILIKVTQESNRLRIEITDTGLGFSDLDKPGLGIANVRARIGLLFGAEGRLIIEENNPHGIRATIEVPVIDL